MNLEKLLLLTKSDKIIPDYHCLWLKPGSITSANFEDLLEYCEEGEREFKIIKTYTHRYEVQELDSNKEFFWCAADVHTYCKIIKKV